MGRKLARTISLTLCDTIAEVKYHERHFLLEHNILYSVTLLDVCSTRAASSGFPNRSDANRHVQSRELARSWKFRIYEEEGLHYQGSESADQQLVCAFVFGYAIIWFL